MCYPVVMSKCPAPLIDFDWDGGFARYQLTAIMCWPDLADRSRRLASIWADLADALDDQCGPFLTDVRHTLDFHGVPPPEEALDCIIDDCARDASHREALAQLVEDVALPPPSNRDVSLAARFWGAIIIARDRDVPPDKYIWHHLIQPIGGLRAIADSLSIDQVRDEVADCICGHPMLAGLSFYLIATIDRYHKDLTLSYNETYRIVSATFDHRRVRSVDWLKTRLPRWHCVAPLWAAALAEANCWLDDALLDTDKFKGEFPDVIHLNDRRRRVLSYGAWFSNFIVKHGSDNIRRRRDQVVRFPDTVQPIEPVLRPLAGRVLAAARRYR
jgi:hypothetical protein